jgi:hypothetical protein
MLNEPFMVRGFPNYPKIFGQLGKNIGDFFHVAQYIWAL